MRWMFMLLGAAVACGGSHSGFGDDDGEDDAGSSSDAPFHPNDSGMVPNADGSAGSDGGGPALIYAHTDTELYTLDPNSHQVTDIGPFSLGAQTPVITDLAVDANGNVWVNSETAIYTAAVPSAPGPVVLTLVANISAKSNQKFYALGFAPANVLDASETLVGGDSDGALWAIATNGTTTELGTFGTDSKGNAYELSGDIVFYVQNGVPLGLATIRSCPQGTCSTTNDLLAEVDVAAMTAAYKSSTPGKLLKQLIGSGTGYGRLFGVGAWNDSVYAFSREATSSPAELVQIGSNGSGQVLETFSQINSGWSGAGVTTKAPITVVTN
jgi:hypothetical protein